MANTIIRGRSIDGTVYLQLRGAVIGWTSHSDEATRFPDDVRSQWWLSHVKMMQINKSPDDITGHLVLIDAPRLPTMFEAWWDDVKEYAHFDQLDADGYFDPERGPGKSPQPTYFGSLIKGVFVVTWALIEYVIRCAICKRYGHKIVDESYGGPETGCVSLHCTRCGFDHHETLY